MENWVVNRVQDSMIIPDVQESLFPLLQNFINYHRNGELTNPDDVAQKLLPFCLGELGQNGDRLDVRNL